MSIASSSHVVRSLLRGAVLRLVDAALAQARQESGGPVIVASAFRTILHRDSQEMFTALPPLEWLAPFGISRPGGLDQFPEMAQVRRVIREDRVLASRVDTMVGPWFNRSRRDLDQFLVSELLRPLVLAAGGYDVDISLVERLYARLEGGLLLDEVRVVDVLPLNGLVMGLPALDLPGGYCLRAMTDRELVTAIDAHAVPVDLRFGHRAVRVPRESQCALTRSRSYPLLYGENVPAEMRTPPVPDYPLEAGQRLVTALRIACGGSIGATRSWQCQHEDEFPIIEGATTLLTPLGMVDPDRPCTLLAEHTGDLARIFTRLGHIDVAGDAVLGIVLRRLVDAGVRTNAVDRLIDLMISAEALFLKRVGTSAGNNLKGAAVANAAAAMLRTDSALTSHAGATTSLDRRIRQVMITCYQRRNAEMHGDPNPTRRQITRLNGTKTVDLATALDDLDLIIRRASTAS